MSITHHRTSRSDCRYYLVNTRLRFILEPNVSLILLTGLLALAGGLVPNRMLLADEISNKNGTIYSGELGAIREFGESPYGASPGEVELLTIIFVDDGLRRTFMPKWQLTPNGIRTGIGDPVTERIQVRQRVSEGNRSVGEVGQLLYVSPFDDYGRRVVGVNSERGPLDIHQGITEINPEYCLVQSIYSGSNNLRWRLRVATSSIPRDTLSRIVYRQIDPSRLADRLKVVKLYQAAGRYRDASEELEAIVADFPDAEAFESLIAEIRSAYARQIKDELVLRYDAGQERLALRMVESFPTAGIGSAVLGEVGTFQEQHVREISRIEAIKELLDKQVEQALLESALAEDEQARLSAIMEEIGQDLNRNNQSRMADFYRLVDNADMTADQKVALAVTGWLLGAGSGESNLAVALSQVEVRNLVHEYLSTADADRRRQILEELEKLEGSLPNDLAKLVANLLPVKPTQQDFAEGIPGFYRFQVPGVAEDEVVEYLVQLPPEYDPYRRYPCIVTLGDGYTPSQQVDWWAGKYNPNSGMRMGQATRHGYIVIAPTWRSEFDQVYRYSAREHGAVLFSLQDAMRRFSIDSDKVFLSGHSQGGTAAWDIGLAHPDLWAGVLPVVASAGRYINRYWKNARNHSAYYFVQGEYDHKRMEANKRDWNRYFTRPGFDVTMTQYLGRGHEDFYEEIHRMFEWMNLHERDFHPKEFEAERLRPTDRFFWWVEGSDFMPATVLVPAAYYTEHDARVGVMSGRIVEAANGANSIFVDTSAAKVTLWFSPELVDFTQPFTLRVNKTTYRNQEVTPDREVLLEDVRTRADRQHPFWARFDHSSSRQESGR